MFGIKSQIKDYLFITLGISCYALGFAFFLLPYTLATGGIAGVGALIYYATGFETQYTFFIINIILLAAAIKELGWKFCIRTIYGVVYMTFALWAAQRLYELAGSPQMVGDEKFLACLIGAMFEGVGLSFCFLSGGSTGGTDIIAAIVNKYKNISLGMGIMLTDVFVILSVYFVFHDVQRIVFGLVLLVVANLTLDFCINRQRQSVEFKIYSRNANAIANAINKTGRGVTMINGMGWYTKSERKVIISVVRRSEQVRMFRMIKSIDPYCFVTMGNVSGVYGEGFDAIKVSDKGSDKNRKILVLTSMDDEHLEEMKQTFDEKYQLRTLEDIGCDINNPLNSDIQGTNASLRARFVKHFYGYDCLAFGTSISAENNTIYALTTGDSTKSECFITKFSSLDEVKKTLI